METPQSATISTPRQLEEIRVKRIHVARVIKDTLFISLGIMSATFGLKGFLLPDEFLDGGAVGICVSRWDNVGVCRRSGSDGVVQHQQWRFDSPGGDEATERMGLVRHVRERVGVVLRLVRRLSGRVSR